MGTSRSQVGHQRFCWMRVWHSACSWLKLIVAAESVAGNTRTGMFTRLIFRNPFQVGRAAIEYLFVPARAACQVLLLIIGKFGLERTSCTELHAPVSFRRALAR